ncbi:TIGR00153 family protein [Rhizorhabdus histidinilytica]|uniref:TIGR00153 family protein n=1 Tax=Rhizorhabdus histidinilytica TaxID=439228 RepID=A0A1T5ANW9_9SPHN|nr:TIGR00153 family protein [Rhizorhabdus histidinilytica]
MQRNCHICREPRYARGIRTIRQIAVLPYRTTEAGQTEVLLITSRETKRWVLPKGNRIKGLKSHEAASHEAYEEAGLVGIACPYAIGTYQYRKQRRNGTSRPATVDIFPFSVTTQLDSWPEKDERELRWFTPQAAAAAVDEEELRDILAGFTPPVWNPGLAERVVTATRRHTAERFTIVRWFQALLPKQGSFFEQFEAHAALNVAAADALGRLLQGGPDMPLHSQEIFDRENEADDIIRDVLVDVRKTLITPFDRTAITSLIGSMDDAIDQMNQTAKAITLYEVQEFEPQMRDMAGLIVEAARITADAMPLLRDLGRNAGRLHSLTERIVRLEGHADEIHAAGLKTLFKAKGDKSPMAFIIGREIYSHLEKITDAFEDVANEIQGLVLDHA